MDKEEFKKNFKDTLDNMYNIMERKNSDYAKTSAFWNFELVEKLWITSIEKWILVRMADKMSRISTLIDQDAKVKRWIYYGYITRFSYIFSNFKNIFRIWKE